MTSDEEPMDNLKRMPDACAGSSSDADGAAAGRDAELESLRYTVSRLEAELQRYQETNLALGRVFRTLKLEFEAYRQRHQYVDQVMGSLRFRMATTWCERGKWLLRPLRFLLGMFRRR